MNESPRSWRLWEFVVWLGLVFVLLALGIALTVALTPPMVLPSTP